MKILLGHQLKRRNVSFCSRSLTECCLHFCDPELTLNTLPMKDPSKPDGKAVNADGSLKPADQIKWLNSPSDELHPPNLGPNEDMGDATPGVTIFTLHHTFPHSCLYLHQSLCDLGTPLSLHIF